MATKDTRITTKELYERLIALEAKFDLMDRDNRRIDKKFTFAVVVVVVLETINALLHIRGLL